MANPPEILEVALASAVKHGNSPTIKDTAILNRLKSVCFCTSNRAPVRFLLSALLAKIHHPNVDIRKPYTEIGGNDSYSGRTYDEQYITSFIITNNLPCNNTTAFLTPAFRTKNTTFTTKTKLEGRPREVYLHTLELLDDVYQDRVPAKNLLVEALWLLLILKKEREERLKSLLKELATTTERIPLSTEGIITLIQQHLRSPNSSRLPVLVVAAAYKAAEKHLGERVLPLESHNAADIATGSLGDIEITLLDDDNVVTTYEMKAKRVLRDDIDHALEKLVRADYEIDNYIFITTEAIDRDISDYAATLYEKTGGTEIVVLDCIGFLRHFLHLFHRLRLRFLDVYQDFVLAQPDSSVRQELKESFLALRSAAESGH